MSGKHWTLGKTIRQGLSKLHSGCPEESLEHFSLKKRWFLNEICTLSKRSSGLCQNFTAGFPKLQSMCPEKNCERDKIWKKDDFLVFLYFEWNKLDSGQSNWAGGCQNCLRRVWRNMERIFQWKKNDISYFLHFEQNYCWLLPNIYGRVSETSIYASGEKFWEKKKWQRDDFLVILYFELKKKGHWAKEFSRGCQSCIWFVQRKLLSIFFFEKTMIFRMIFLLWPKNVRTLPKIYGRVTEISIYVSGEKFCERKILKTDDVLVTLYFEWKELNNGQSNLAWLVKAAFGVSRGTFWAFFNEKTMIFEWFLHFERKSSGLCQTFTAGFPKLQPTCPEKKFVR